MCCKGDMGQKILVEGRRKGGWWVKEDRRASGHVCVGGVGWAQEG